MNATFQVQTIAKHHNGDVEVTLGQVYDHTTRQLNDSTDPDGEISLHITDRTGFFQQGQKYLVNFRSTAPSTSRAVLLADGTSVDPEEQAKYIKDNQGKTPADFVAYKNSQASGRFYRSGDGTHDNDPHRFDRTEQPNVAVPQQTTSADARGDFNQEDPYRVGGEPQNQAEYSQDEQNARSDNAPWKRKQKWQPKADAPATE
jgi:hypothetical protein